MTTIGKTDTLTLDRRPFDADTPIPAILAAHIPPGAIAVDRCIVRPPFVLGRSGECGLSVKESKISKTHFKITKISDGFYIEDLGSTNGTFVNGGRLTHRQHLPDGAVIRAGQSVLVFHEDARIVFEASPPANRLGIVGRFHAAPFLQTLKETVLTQRHLLLAGPSGAGKELTAQAVAALIAAPKAPLKVTAHNAARFSSEEEAASTLFGVATRVFSNVDARPGLIETAQNGVLFIDEIHNLPVRVQRTLLRVIEEGRFSRIGETSQNLTDVRFVFASNAPPPDHELALDLLARLMVLNVPSLRERVADIPGIFNHVLEHSMGRHGIPVKDALNALNGDHYESLCLDTFPESNVRGLIDLTDRIAARTASGMPVESAVSSIFAARFAKNQVALRRTGASSLPPKSENTDTAESNSHYERHRDIILSAYRECEGNVSAAERLLRHQGFRCSRRWLGVFLEKWGIRENKS